MKVREMRSADTVLGIIRDRGRRGLPLEDVYRQLFNPALYLLAYGKIARNAGALTPGSTAETADGMSLQTIHAIIAALRQERYRWTPVRRVSIPKAGGKRRPLGLPTWSDKLLQEVIRLILEAYYEPQFSDRSHGFRPGRGCHTALTEICRTWSGTVWFVEGDITQCFDQLDHAVLLAILREQIHDHRFLRLIANLLTAGYLEDWRYHRTLSGTPQGGIVSPILASIYLDRLDRFVETVLIPDFTRGTTRRRNGAYRRLQDRRQRLRRRGDTRAARALLVQQRQLPAGDPVDPGYRRLRYIRYADDFLLGFAGPRTEAETIKQRLGAFLRETLALELSEAKTRITHGRTEAARFLGYDVVVLHDNTKCTNGVRSISAGIGLKVPGVVVRDRCARFLRHGKPVHQPQRVNDAVFSIIASYAQEYRGVVDYYRLAYNLHRLQRLAWVMETSLTKTLAAKLRLSVARVYRRFGSRVPTKHGSRCVLQASVERDGKPPLVATWGRTNLMRKTDAVLIDTPAQVWNGRTEIVERLLAETCELCGAQQQVEVHHIRALKDLTQPGRPAKPAWMRTMAARHRTKLVVCRACHLAIQHGRPRRRADQTQGTGEPGAGKLACPVRRGADGKVPTEGPDIPLVPGTMRPELRDGR
jgi:group II intron reverse transcriptase/maturase